MLNVHIAGVLESLILMLYELLHKRCVSFLQYIHDSHFVLVSQTAVWLGFLWGVPLGYFIGFLGPGLSLCLQKIWFFLLMSSYGNMELVLIMVFFLRSWPRVNWRFRWFWQSVFLTLLTDNASCKNSKVQEASSSFFNIMSWLFIVVLNIKAILIFITFARFFPLGKFCVLT